MANSARPKTNQSSSRKRLVSGVVTAAANTEAQYQYGGSTQNTILFDEARLRNPGTSSNNWAKQDIFVAKNSSSVKASNAPSNANMNGQRQLYVCCGCNTPLFTSKDFVEHTSRTMVPQQAQFAATANNFTSGANCQYYFVRQREWMTPLVEQAGSKNAGQLECYRKVCRRRLG
jgi:hypothetical protein